MAQKVPPFFTLPFELRLRIYQLVLDKRTPFHPMTYLSIATVCRQIRAEVLPIILQEDRYLRSLDHLEQWTSRGTPELLELVQNVTLHVDAESLSLMTRCRRPHPRGEYDSHPHTAGWWEDRYEEQLETDEIPQPQRFSFTKIVNSLNSWVTGRSSAAPAVEKNSIAATWLALTKLRQLKKIWIDLTSAAGTDTSSSSSSCTKSPYDIEQRLILSMIASACPGIREFSLFSNLVPLNFLRDLHDLRQLRFSGYSQSTPEETLSVLRGLEELDSIIIYRFPEHYDREYSIATADLSRYLSITPCVLSCVRPLKRFEISHMTSSIPSAHVTVPILRALRAHSASLRALSIHSDRPVNGEYLEELLDFIRSSALSSLYLNLTVPGELEALLDTHLVFPSSARFRERKISRLDRTSARLGPLSVRVRASS